MNLVNGYFTWADVTPRIEAGETVHAAIGGPGSAALCGVDTAGPIILDLTHPEARAHRHTVTCPACLEWLHA